MPAWLHGTLYASSYLLPAVLVGAMAATVFPREPLTYPEAPTRAECDDVQPLFEAHRQTWNQVEHDFFRAQTDALARGAARCANEPRTVEALLWALRLDGRWDHGREVLREWAHTAGWSADVLAAVEAELDSAALYALQREGRHASPPFDALRQRLERTTSRLLQRWPAWPKLGQMHYQAVTSAGTRAYVEPDAPTLWEGIGRWARGDAAMSVLVLIPLFGGVLLGVGLRASYRRRPLEDPEPTVLAQARGRYAPLKARLGIPPGHSPVRHPRDGTPCLWHPGARTQRNNRSVPLYPASTQPVLMRDALGEHALMELAGAEVDPPAEGSSSPADEAALARLRATPGGRLVLRWAPLFRSITGGPGRGYLVEGDEVLVVGRVRPPTAGAELPRIGDGGIGRPLYVLGRGIESRIARLRLLADLCGLAVLLMTALYALTYWQRYEVEPRTPWAEFGAATPSAAAVPASSGAPTGAIPPPG